MQDKGLVSIIMPSYNCGRYVEESIRSIQAQTYQNWELLFVEDCSLDDTLARVMALKDHDSRINVFQNIRHSGAAIARNTALRNARGKWVAFLDSDDVWEPNKLEHQIEFMVANNYYFSCHNYIEIDEESKETGVFVSSKKRIGKMDMYACCWPGCLTVMYDADYVGLIQISDICMNNDTAMWLKIVEKAECYLLDETLARYRRRKDSITRNNKLERITGHYRLFHHAQKKDMITSTFLMVLNVFGNAYKKMKYVKHYEV